MRRWMFVVLVLLTVSLVSAADDYCDVLGDDELAIISPICSGVIPENDLSTFISTGLGFKCKYVYLGIPILLDNEGNLNFLMRNSVGYYVSSYHWKFLCPSYYEENSNSGSWDLVNLIGGEITTEKAPGTLINFNFQPNEAKNCIAHADLDSVYASLLDLSCVSKKELDNCNVEIPSPYVPLEESICKSTIELMSPGTWDRTFAIGSNPSQTVKDNSNVEHSLNNLKCTNVQKGIPIIYDSTQGGYYVGYAYDDSMSGDEWSTTKRLELYLPTQGSFCDFDVQGTTDTIKHCIDKVNVDSDYANLYDSSCIENCINNIDDDGDGLVNCEDNDCLERSCSYNNNNVCMWSFAPDQSDSLISNRVGCCAGDQCVTEGGSCIDIEELPYPNYAHWICGDYNDWDYCGPNDIRNKYEGDESEGTGKYVCENDKWSPKCTEDGKVEYIEEDGYLLCKDNYPYPCGNIPKIKEFDDFDALCLDIDGREYWPSVWYECNADGVQKGSGEIIDASILTSNSDTPNILNEIYLCYNDETKDKWAVCGGTFECPIPTADCYNVNDEVGGYICMKENDQFKWVQSSSDDEEEEAAEWLKLLFTSLPECTSNNDCDDNKECTNDFCWDNVCFNHLFENGCCTSENCEEGQFCDLENYQCSVKFCVNHDDCNDNKECTLDFCTADYVCKSLPKTESGCCASSFNCIGDEFCDLKNHHCLDKKQGGESCAGDQECTSNNCMDGECTCVADEDCDGDGVLYENDECPNTPENKIVIKPGDYGNSFDDKIGCPVGDLNKDGIVNQNDLVLIDSNFGNEFKTFQEFVKFIHTMRANWQLLIA